MVLRGLLTACLAAAALVAGCGEGEGGRERAPAPGPRAGPEHIHGLGVNPADGALLIATHTGLFRAARGERRARRVGDRHQDTMGFTVVGPDRFLGSGHPDLRDDLPPLLGLVRSTDGGRTWASVSLLGQADFHVLRAAGRRVYGFDASHGRLLVSADGGRTWRERRPPGPLVDLAIDPADSDHVVASGEAALFTSNDAGRTWRPLAERAGLLAWPDALVLVDAEGHVHASSDGGRTFREVGEAGGRPAALAHGGGEVYVALHDNVVRASADGGRTWRVRVGA